MQTCAMSSGYMTVMTDTHPNTVDMMTLPDTALMSPDHVCSLYHCIDSVWRVWRCWRGRNPGQTASASARTAPLLSHRSSPAATCDHQPEPSTGQRNYPPPSYLLTTGWAWAVSALPSQVALSFVLCIRNNIITSSNIVSVVFQDTHVLDNNCV